MTLPTHTQLSALAGECRDLIHRIEEEYRWAIAGAWAPDVRETAKVRSTANPTETVATDEDYIARRDALRRGHRQLEEARNALRSCLGHLEDAQPRYQPTEHVHKAGVAHPAAVGEAKEAKRRRGEGYGQS